MKLSGYRDTIKSTKVCNAFCAALLMEVAVVGRKMIHTLHSIIPLQLQYNL